MSTQHRVDRENAIKILIVEDDGVLASIWQTYLQGNGCKVDVCGSVEDAEVLFHSNSYDLAIIDIFFQHQGRQLEQGGVTLINRVNLDQVMKADEEKIKLIAVTGTPARAQGHYDLLSGINRLVDCILRKPIPLEVLGEKVNRLMSVAAL